MRGGLVGQIDAVLQAEENGAISGKAQFLGGLPHREPIFLEFMKAVRNRKIGGTEIRDKIGVDVARNYARVDGGGK